MHNSWSNLASKNIQAFISGSSEDVISRIMQIVGQRILQDKHLHLMERIAAYIIDLYTK